MSMFQFYQNNKYQPAGKEHTKFDYKTQTERYQLAVPTKKNKNGFTQHRLMYYSSKKAIHQTKQNQTQQISENNKSNIKNTTKITSIPNGWSTIRKNTNLLKKEVLNTNFKMEEK